MRPITTKSKDRVARWIGFLALAALFAMATLPPLSGHRDATASNTTHWGSSWQG
jgi:hypothetical protein